MSETIESQENQNEEAAVPAMTTVERAEMLLQQDAAIYAKINDGATLDEAVDPGNKEFGPLAHPEQVQMRVAKRAMMLKDGIQPYPVTLDVTATIEEVRAKYDGKLEAGDETEDVVGIAGRVLFLRNAGGLCFVQLSAGDGTKIQGMISKKEIGSATWCATALRLLLPCARPSPITTSSKLRLRCCRPCTAVPRLVRSPRI